MRELESTGLNREVLSVSALNRTARRLLEGEFPMIWVEGEISNFARPASGHWYFTLKDHSAQVRCAMFRNRNQLMRAKPRDGSHVIVRGRISLYEGRGEFQLIAEHLEEGGDGELRRAYEQLKMKLQTEGLFDDERKKPIPPLPRHIGIITSPQGAAIHDVLTVLGRRFPAINVTILPVSVQGMASASEIRAQLAVANDYRQNPFDILLLTRGGGSLEDLVSFNSEVVARAISRSDIPVVCAVGHESDVSIADFVADLRAPTPSAAAELISPDRTDWLARIDGLGRRIEHLFETGQRRRAQQLTDLTMRLRQPGRRLDDLNQRIDELEARLTNGIGRNLRAFDLQSLQRRLQAGVRGRLERASARLEIAAQSLRDPRSRISSHGERNGALARHLQAAMRHTLTKRRGRLEAAAAKLNALSPLATLDRGYAIATDANHHVVTAATSASPGDIVNVRLQQGQLVTEVKEIHD